MISLYESHSVSDVDSEEPFANLPTREKILDSLRADPNFDLIVLGGGLTGALLAHRATLSGIRVLLLEPRYFGYGSLSWDHRLSSQLRRNPYKLLAARATLCNIRRGRFNHFLSPMPFDSHLIGGLGVQLVRKTVPLVNLDERLLIRELVLAARQEGASVLAGIDVKFLEAESAASGCYTVAFDDLVNHSSCKVRVGGVFVDPTFGELPLSRLGSRVVSFEGAKRKNSGGVQVVFNAQAKPGYGGGLSYVSFELSDRSFISIKRSGIGSVSATILYSGERLLPNDEQAIISDALNEGGWVVLERIGEREVFNSWSARYEIRQNSGVFSCDHTAPWDSFRSAATILDSILALAPREGKSFKSSTGKQFFRRDLPGAELNCEVDRFRALARAQGISERTIELVVSRWRGRVRYLASFANGLWEVTPGVLRGEVDLSVLSDQVVSFEDMTIGSLGRLAGEFGCDGEHRLRERSSVFGLL